MTTYKQQAINRDNACKDIRKLGNYLMKKKMGTNTKEDDRKAREQWRGNEQNNARPDST